VAPPGQRGATARDHAADPLTNTQPWAAHPLLTLAPRNTGVNWRRPVGTSCVFPFTVADVAGGSDFYQVEVTHRGKITVSDADARDGKASFTLGA
jgi:hypothetical protein